MLKYEDDYCIINKPAGISVHHGGGSVGRRLVVNTMLKRQLARKVLPVHRLDHRTSGALLFAFSPQAAARLQEVLAKSSQKTYLAFVRGEWMFEEKVVVVNEPVKVGDGSDAVSKDALTEFQCLATQSEGDKTRAASLILCNPKTGRTHQIRKHLRHLAHPIIGDSAHGDSKVNRWWREERGFNRMGLHALALDLEGVSVVAPLGDGWKGIHEEDVWRDAAIEDERLTMPEVDVRGGSYGRNFSKNCKAT